MECGVAFGLQTNEIDFAAIAGMKFERAVGLIADAVSRRWFGRQIDWASMLEAATSFGWVQLVLIAILLILIRRIVIRLNMPDTRLGPER